MSLRVRSTVYRNRPGYLICGRPLGNVALLRIFCHTLPVARLIQRLGNDKHIAAYGTGSIERGEFWMRVLDGLLISEVGGPARKPGLKSAAADLGTVMPLLYSITKSPIERSYDNGNGERTACNPSGLG